VRGSAPGPGVILSNIIFSQLEAHRPFGGVVPEIAARAHVERLDEIIETAIGEAGTEIASLDAIAATAGPGLIGGVMVGLTTAKALALATGKPLIAVNHLEAHALTARLTRGVAFPFLLLLISGGHCQLLAVEGIGAFRLYGTTIDDAVGEAFDKVAKLMGLPYPGGPRIEELARNGRASRYALPKPMAGRSGADFSFSGLKTAARQIVRSEHPNRAALAASFQEAVVTCLVDRTSNAIAAFRADHADLDNLTLVVAGGVAANLAVREGLTRLCAREDLRLIVPPPRLCTDNAAMVAWAGLERGQLGLLDSAGVAPRARWPLDARDGGRNPAAPNSSLTS